MHTKRTLKRRFFLKKTSLFALMSGFMPKLSIAASIDRKSNAVFVTPGCSIGDVSANSAVLWCRTNRSALVSVELSQGQDFTRIEYIKKILSAERNDFNCKIELDQLSSHTRYFYRISCFDKNQKQTKIKPETSMIGTFETASLNELNPIKFHWSGDTVGQGYGIDPKHGGLKTYEAMLKRDPDFFVHCGDQIYADNPLEPVKKSPDGTLWNNTLTLSKAKVAESVQAFRENFYYNFLDKHFRTFHKNVATYHLWDDHEVVNNWYHGEVLDDARYTEKQVSVLVARAKQAFTECLPIRYFAVPDDANKAKTEASVTSQTTSPTTPQITLYRHVPRGPLLDLFLVDLRSYKGPNSVNRQKEYSKPSYLFGPDQLDWLKQSIKESKGLWKIICIGMPLSVRVTEWQSDVAENAANGEGMALGRELEYKNLLGFLREHNIKNVHFITADVHYCASYHCDPERATEKAFMPFWEFVSGPLHAGTFGPNEIDPTFGPKAEFIGLPESFVAGASPASNLQFFGEIEIDPDTKSMKVSHINRLGEVLWSTEMSPA